MILVTTDFISDKKIKTLSIVKGSMVKTRNMFVDIGQGFKHMWGGELRAYNNMMDKSREIATDRMIADAKKLGADAIIGIRYSTSAVMQGAAEVIVYGTAVKFIK